MDWHADAQEVHAFGSVLVTVEVLQDREAVLYYFEKPWKWSTEHDLWVGLGCPNSPDDGAWPEFDTAIDRLML